MFLSGVNACRTHWESDCERISQTTFGGGLALVVIRCQLVVQYVQCDLILRKYASSCWLVRVRQNRIEEELVQQH